ncbi:MAG: M23 family metallopeptidase [Mariprofundaceae bacterium]|nr:M23 family metallopeptidase [Mariprofundaceae bacterium]
MQQDFANSVVQESESPLMAKRRSSPRQPLSVKPVMLGVAGFVAGAFMLTLLLVGHSVDASVPVIQEEWLAVSPLKQVEGQSSKKVILQPGDAAVSALGKLGFPFAEVIRMTKASKGIYSLKKVHAGQAFSRMDEGSRTHVYYGVDSKRRLHLFTSEGEGWQAELQQRAVNRRQVRASGVIQDSLFAAAVEAGIDERTTMNLIDIFGWDVDFARDLRAGDSFSVLYEEYFDDQGYMRGSVILAAEFSNQGESYKAIRYELESGNTEYFTPDGSSMRKTYLKSPVKFSRISSRFSRSRKHPVLGYNRAHRGVDYASARGTPIRAIGDGRVAYAGRKGGYGRFVEIRHTNSAHSTAYAHMLSYGRGIKRGTRVKQGQIIGYVGMSGVATGPHLHFEFRVRGRAVNPLAVKHAPAKPVPEKELVQFRQVAGNLLGQLSWPQVALAWE